MILLFWTIFCFATILWYIVVTLIVAIKGANDIKNMLKQIGDEPNASDKIK